MGGGSSSSGLSGLLGGGGGGFDPTTGSPIGSPAVGDPSGAFWGNPSNPAVTETTPTQAAQNIQAASNQSFDPTTASSTGSQSGPSTPDWVKNLSDMFLGGGTSPAGVRPSGSAFSMGPAAPSTPSTPSVGWPTGSAAAVTSPSPVQTGTTAGLPEGTPGQTALNLPQSAPVSGKTQAVSEPAAAAPAPETAQAPAADTTNYPDVSGTSREAGMGPTGPATADTGVSASGTGVPPVLQDLFSLNFGKFISDLLGQQGMPAGQNQAAAPAPSTDTGTEGTTGDKATADAGQKAQTPAQKAAGVLNAAGEAVKPKQSPVESGPGSATAAPTPPAGPTTPTAPATPGAEPARAPAGTPLGPAFSMGAAAPSRSGSYDPTTGRTVPGPAAAAGPSYNPTTGAPVATPQQAPAGTPLGPAFSMGAPPTPAGTPAATPSSQFAAPATTAGAGAGAAASAPAPGQKVSSLEQPPGGRSMPDGSRVPTNGMPGGLTPNAPPPLPGLGAIPNQQNRPRHYEGTLTMPDGTKYRYGTGGGQFASAPYGTYQIHPGAVGSIGKSIGAWAGYSDSSNPGNNTVHDPLYKGAGGTSARAGVEIHPDVSGRQLKTNGCIGIDRGQSAAFGRSFKAAAKQGPLMMTIKPGGEITVFYANSQQPAVAGTIPPPTHPRNIDQNQGRAGVVSG